ncbi:ABC transporter permease [Paenibacillus sp. FSL H7-0331]|uniref:ABC transporter permease n=1 Tax=Paenibacillus sp. FSL H7-0331 TaxID=1920421 RepID=UPI00096C31F1|nr:ABC transporter permease [Paenibacillus sp. FSL H7-0331]OMF04325.1 ABC transporter permease [Paenibacillus sp. FSL H7-0331]
MSTPTEQLSASPSRSAGHAAHPSLWRSRLNDTSISFAVPLLIVIVWQVLGATGVVDTFFLPTPWEIIKGFKELFVTGELLLHIGVSVGRAASGFLLGGSIAFLFAVWTGFSRRSENLIDPSIQWFRMIPNLAIAPLIILWFGFSETSKIVIIAVGSFFPIYINTFIGIRSVDNKLFEVAKVLQFNRYKQIVRLILPSSLPNVLLGVRLSLAISWLSLVVAELIGASAGVGHMILFSSQSARTDLVFVGVIIFAIIGKLIDSLVKYLDRKWIRWRDSYRG